MHHLFDHQFLATSTGIIVGLVLGVIGAVVSYLFWYVGAVLAGAWLGAVIGAGLMRVFDVSPDSIWVAIAAIVGAIILAVITVALNLPIYMVIVNTAFTGAAWVVGGAMLIFDRLDRQELGYGTVWAAIDENWFWAIAWIIVAALGLGAQLTRLQEARLPEDPWTRAPQTI